jgi:thiamine-phosphate diphosphorylase
VRPVLCLVTDRYRLAGHPASRSGAREEADVVVECAAAAARAGVDLIQVRERDLEGDPLTRLVRRCVEAVAGTRTRVLVNDRVDVALAAGAHGVHLPGHGVPAARVRAIVPRGFLIGRSVHHATEAARVVGEGGLDYLVFGTVFATASKPGIAPAGLEGLAAAAAAVPLPVLAIGGVDAARALEIARTGAAGAAAIEMFARTCEHGIDGLYGLVAQWAREWSSLNGRARISER